MSLNLICNSVIHCYECGNLTTEGENCYTCQHFNPVEIQAEKCIFCSEYGYFPGNYACSLCKDAN